MFSGFESTGIETGEARIFLRRAGAGMPLLLLHGFPQTHAMWSKVASLLAPHFTVICPDLRGYGLSSCPASTPDHAPYSKRAMASDMVAVMEQLGFARFCIAGHDRGGRVAYRLALDHPQRVTRLAVLDILPTADVWDRADATFALGYWPWLLLAQPEPLPEQLIAAAPAAIVDAALGGWGTPATAFDQETRSAYIDALRNPVRIHSICEEYRAAASIDREHDISDRTSGRRIACPVLVLWSGRGPLNIWYEAAGGPLGIWRGWCNEVSGQPLEAGHFFPEENPEQTARALLEFFTSAR